MRSLAKTFEIIALENRMHPNVGPWLRLKRATSVSRVARLRPPYVNQNGTTTRPGGASASLQPAAEPSEATPATLATLPKNARRCM